MQLGIPDCPKLGSATAILQTKVQRGLPGDSFAEISTRNTRNWGRIVAEGVGKGVSSATPLAALHIIRLPGRDTILKGGTTDLMVSKIAQLRPGRKD